MIDVDLNTVAIPLAWEELFGRSGPVHVEIGSGNNRFLIAMAEAHPEWSFLGVERSAKYHSLGCERAARRGLANLRLIRTTGEDLLFRLLPAHRVSALYVLFPDPWPKKRHHKRRLFADPEILTAAARVLASGGRLLVKTDHPGYAEVIAEALANPPGFRSVVPAAAFAQLPASGYEEKYRREDRPIHVFALECLTPARSATPG